MRAFRGLSLVTAMVLLGVACTPTPPAQQAAPGTAATAPARADSSKGEIRIGLLAPLTGVLAQAAQDSVDGYNLFWNEVGAQAAGRPVRTIVADYGCTPDGAISHARRLISQEKVHFLIGPLCSQTAAGVAQVSKETGVPVLMHVASADPLTKWDRTPTVVRTGGSSSQYTHPLGEFVYSDQGCRKVTSLASDYTFGHETVLGAIAAYEGAGGQVVKQVWFPMGTKDFGPVLAGIPSETDCVIATAIGAEAPRLIEAWFDFGYNKRFKIYGAWWLVEDTLLTMDERAVGLYGASHAYFSGLQTPEAQAFSRAFAEKYKRLPGFYAESSYSTALWAKTAIEAINGNVEDPNAFLTAVRQAKIKAPRGPLELDSYDNPIQNVYITQVEQQNHPVLGKVLVPVPVKTYEKVSQFWKWSPEEYLKRGPYKR